MTIVWSQTGSLRLDETTVNDRADRRLIYFRSMATQPLPSDDKIDQEKTPLVFIQKPQKKRGTLWSDAEVDFTLAIPAVSGAPKD